ncbi:DapH/DapD/GlmU-related protein [Candidatus Chloroploca asiatica]|uniref:Multidrug transporter n=1 Tax=Candidatus Chloroploca asiatica TaxID=1506545 RepID=A0A2H3L8Q5_9CHLR|nr:DapH/DapD/GlmU-related protein [Candidatus Chloroploca asiatica]PDV98686.1 multidrug transporter [Candidatus Chloroploca asiatica]
MERIIIRDHQPIAPFAEPARELRILNKPLWLLQRDLLKHHCKGSLEINSIEDLFTEQNSNSNELLVYRDNLFFNANLIDAFISAARASGRACQIAFRASNPATGVRGDPTIERHALQLTRGFVARAAQPCLDDGRDAWADVYLAELYYFPHGPVQDPTPLIIETQSHEMGYYHIPSYMAHKGDLTYQIPLRAFLSLESWVHVFIANILMGVFTDAAAQDVKMSRARLKDVLHWKREDWRIFVDKAGFSAAAIWQRLNPFEEMWRNHFLASHALVKVGKNCSIDPSATIHGPTVIGDNVYIGPGVVIANSIIGNNVNVMQGSQVMLSVVSDRCFLPFNAGLFMTTLMENSMVAQNSTLQLTVVGRNTFIGANNCFTDFNLQNEPIKVMHRGEAVEVHLPVLGSAVGHNVKIGSGFVVYPGRMIESNTVIIFDHDQGLISKTVRGHDVDDVDVDTSEPRRIIYHWPNVYHDPAQPDQPEPPGASLDQIQPAYSNGSCRSNGDHHDASTLHEHQSLPTPARSISQSTGSVSQQHQRVGVSPTSARRSIR